MGAKWRARAAAAKGAAAATRRISFVSLAIALLTSLSYYVLFPVLVCMGRRMPMTMENFKQAYRLLGGDYYYLLFGISLILVLIIQLSFAMFYLCATYIPDFGYRILCFSLGIVVAGYTLYLSVMLTHEFFAWGNTQTIDDGVLWTDTFVGGVALLGAAFAAKYAEDRKHAIARIALWTLEGLLVIVAVASCFF